MAGERKIYSKKCKRSGERLEWTDELYTSDPTPFGHANIMEEKAI